MENDFYLCIYIIYYIRSKRKNGMARNRYIIGVMKCARIVFGAIIAFRLISLASHDAASYNCTFNGAIIDSRETKRRRGERRRRARENCERFVLSSSGIIYAIRAI